MHIASMTKTPSAMAKNCLYSLSGSELATTAKFNVDRKKAIASISKPSRPLARTSATYPHITSISPPMQIKRLCRCSVPSTSHSCSIVKS